MKILSAFNGRKMTVTYLVEGEEKKKNFNLAHVKQDASYENIYAVAQALGSLVNVLLLAHRFLTPILLTKMLNNLREENINEQGFKINFYRRL